MREKKGPGVNARECRVSALKPTVRGSQRRCQHGPLSDPSGEAAGRRASQYTVSKSKADPLNPFAVSPLGAQARPPRQRQRRRCRDRASQQPGAAPQRAACSDADRHRNNNSAVREGLSTTRPVTLAPTEQRSASLSARLPSGEGRVWCLLATVHDLGVGGVGRAGVHAQLRADAVLLKGGAAGRLDLANLVPDARVRFLERG